MVDRGLLEAGYNVCQSKLAQLCGGLTHRHQIFMLDDCYSLRERNKKGRIVEGQI